MVAGRSIRIGVGMAPARGPPLVASVPASYADQAYFPTSTPVYAGSTATLTATYTGGVNNFACAFFHYDSTIGISSVTFDGSAATYDIVSGGTNPSAIVARAPCPTSGTHTWVVTFGAAAPTTQGTTVTMIGVTSPPRVASVLWGNYSPTTTGSITVSSNGIAMTFLGSVDTTGAWSGATAISTGSGNFPLAYSTSSATVSYNGAATGSHMATLSWDAASSPVTTTGSIAATDASDTALITAIAALGRIAATDAADTANIIAITALGRIAATETKDAASITAITALGRIAATETKDAASITAITALGRIAATETKDAAAVAAITALARIAATDKSDTASIITAITTFASIAAIDAADIASITASGGAAIALVRHVDPVFFLLGLNKERLA